MKRTAGQAVLLDAMRCGVLLTEKGATEREREQRE